MHWVPQWLVEECTISVVYKRNNDVYVTEIGVKTCLCLSIKTARENISHELPVGNIVTVPEFSVRFWFGLQNFNQNRSSYLGGGSNHGTTGTWKNNIKDKI